MTDNTETETISHMKDIVEQELNHLVRHEENVEGIINIRSKTDNLYDIELHDGKNTRSQTIEDVSKDELIKLMEKQL
jgi:hypothetical protein